MSAELWIIIGLAIVSALLGAGFLYLLHVLLHLFDGW